MTGLSEPRLSQGTVSLVPLVPSMYAELFSMATESDALQRWRLFGTPPRWETFPELLWADILVQFAVLHRGDFAGLVQAYGANFRHRTGKLAVLFASRVRGQGAPMVATGLFISYVFQTFDLRKLYAEIPEFNYPLFESGEGRFFEIEGRLADHEYHGGRYFDTVLLAIDAHHWRENGAQLFL